MAHAAALPYNALVVEVREIDRPADWQRVSGPRFDSGPTVGPWSRWEYRLGPPVLLLTCDPATRSAALYDAAGLIRQWQDPLEALQEALMPGAPPMENGPPFKGGWAGWLSYDLGRLFEHIPSLADDDMQLPLLEMGFYPHVVAHDLARDVFYECRCPTIAAGPIEFRPPATRCERAAVERNMTRQRYLAAAERAIEYIRAGDVYQVNLAQRFAVHLPDSPQRIYERLITRSPAWFGAYLPYGDHALLCNSPELFLRITPAADGARTILTRPVKGTRPRRPGMDRQLLASVKDQAELNMIVDLERNDLGRICRIGSVRVIEGRVIEEHPTVYHGAATIEGVLREEVTMVDVLRATFPGGSITGAPKIRAMQIIEELEPTRRGPYCGAIGYVSIDGHAQFNIAIRTMIVRGQTVYIHVGGGIVADSLPLEEYDETLAKARAMFDALGIEPPQ